MCFPKAYSFEHHRSEVLLILLICLAEAHFIDTSKLRKCKAISLEWLAFVIHKKYNECRA